MKNRRKHYKALKDEIINDPTNQGYNDIFKKKYKNLRDKFTAIAEKLNEGRSKELGFPIVRSNIVELVMRDE